MDDDRLRGATWVTSAATWRARCHTRPLLASVSSLPRERARRTNVVSEHLAPERLAGYSRRLADPPRRQPWLPTRSIVLCSVAPLCRRLTTGEFGVSKNQKDVPSAVGDVLRSFFESCGHRAPLPLLPNVGFTREETRGGRVSIGKIVSTMSGGYWMISSNQCLRRVRVNLDRRHARDTG